MLTYPELKKLLYVLETTFGALLLLLVFIPAACGDPAQVAASWIEVFAGAGLVTFGILTYFFRDDPDVWR
jgi:hypothetical protein